LKGKELTENIRLTDVLKDLKIDTKKPIIESITLLKDIIKRYPDSPPDRWNMPTIMYDDAL